MAETPSPAVAALLAKDAKALRAALAQGDLPDKVQGLPPVYWVVHALADASVEDRAGLMESLELLLSAGFDPDAPGKAKITPLMEACILTDLPAIRRLLSAGADLHARTIMGATALHWAAAAGSVAAVRLLVESGLSVDEKTHTLDTPLHWACERLKRPVIRELYHLGADFHARNTSHRLTPLGVIAKKDRRLAEFWRHKPGRDALERATPPAPNTVPRRSRRL